MIVVDASVICAFLLKASDEPAIGQLLSSDETLAAPELIEYEIGSALRRLFLAGKVSAGRGLQALTDFSDLRIELYPAQMLAQRAWDLRENVSYYDSCYVALAERLGTSLYTRDSRLSATPRHRAKIILI